MTKCKNSFKKMDWRSVKETNHKSHFVIRWFHWSWRPRLYEHYPDKTLGEMRYGGFWK